MFDSLLFSTLIHNPVLNRRYYYYHYYYHHYYHHYYYHRYYYCWCFFSSRKPRLHASDFSAEDVRHIKILLSMGIELKQTADGRLQLTHSPDRVSSSSSLSRHYICHTIGFVTSSFLSRNCLCHIILATSLSSSLPHHCLCHGIIFVTPSVLSCHHLYHVIVFVT